MPRTNEDCAECGKRTDFSKNGKKIKNRQKITSTRLENYFRAKKIDLKIYKYVCRRCYSSLNKLIGSIDILEHVNKLSGLQIKENKSSTVSNRINFNNERCFSLTGLNSDQFGILLRTIECNWPYQISKSDSLFMYLARLRLGKFLKIFCFISLK